ncbi:hypothetical protein ACFQY8_06965 [Alloscardovia venturai]|uniref:DUF8094 domain-containing protein n=1 Tax=Alloscardovia venturai TaxID=1769421 RepID=A0ABW2Y797_9BIFI
MIYRRVLMKLAATGVVCASAVALAACTPSPQKADSNAITPVVTTTQEKAIRTKIIKAINKADAARDTNALKEQMLGPALEVRTSQLKIASATNNLDSSTAIPQSLSQSVVSTSQTWPRNLFAITTVTDTQQSQRLLVLEQQKATANYKVWGLVRLMPGVQMPKFKVATIGSTQGDAQTSGLKATPAEVAKRYADVLENGAKSKYANDFADDAFRTNLQTLTDSVQQAIAQNEGMQSQTYTAHTKDIKVLETADGGALAVIQIDSVWTRTAGGDRQSLPASDSEKALFGDTKATSALEVDYVNEVAIYIPKVGSSEKIRTVGAERQPVAVEAK